MMDRVSMAGLVLIPELFLSFADVFMCMMTIRRNVNGTSFSDIDILTFCMYDRLFSVHCLHMILTLYSSSF